ncbi:unnamed protein product [Parnassius apollo]|uniref:NADH dehydrogenase [ubiquinone] 1 alpha subcomplex subunit 7 n=1 Tax=Parnassius apollo TaxID=110799 RepID=A0A8S3W7B7_PARAO|nr:unnamed protein product [Parnassius apollo]
MAKYKLRFRDVSSGLQKLRDFLLGRKHTLHGRFPPTLAPRTIPPPDIPRGPDYKYSKQYYFKRNALDSVKPPVVAPVAEGRPLAKGTETTKNLSNGKVENVVTATSVRELESAANLALIHIVEWGRSVKLVFGPTKTKLITISTKAKVASINMDGHRLSFVPEVKLLGEKLNFGKHVKQSIRPCGSSTCSALLETHMGSPS